jgi:hypothetical protein
MPDGALSMECPASVDIRAIASALVITRRSADRRAARERWAYTEEASRGRQRRRLYATATLPLDVQAALTLKHARAHGVPAAQREPAKKSSALIAAAHERYERASDKQRADACSAAAALDAVRRLVDAGEALMWAREVVAAQLKRDGVKGSVGSLVRWAADVGDAPRADWPALLLSGHAGRTACAACDETAWDWYKGHYLTRKGPSHADTYRRLERIAKEKGWTLPSARTLQRRLDRDVSHATQVLLRHGAEAASRLVPAQQRDESVFAAGEAVNGDGLKFDTLWVRFPDGEIINTATAWFWQDVAKRKILAWRLDKTENTDVFRLATYDLTAKCAPRVAYIDNTRVAANKLMTAGAKNRHRFKSEPEDGLGLLLMLGIEPQFTNPDKELGNPGAKPIERAFGIGGLHEMVRTHPRFVDRGYSSATAIDVEELREVIGEEVARMNAQPKRRTAACAGILSFDQAWDAGVAQQPPRVLAESQRRLLLLSREVVTCDKRSGLITLEAGRGPHGRNQYWTEHLVEWCSKKVAVHFDPANLSADVHVYTLDGRYLCAAEHKPTRAFNDTMAAREHAKFKARRIKAQKAAAAAEVRMSALERAALYDQASGVEPKPEAKPAGKVTKGHFQRVPDPQRDPQRERATGTDDVVQLRRERSLDDVLKRMQEKQIAESGWKKPD